MEILLVCTGNICRSPMAEALLRQRLADRGVDGAVSSAGLYYDGEPASGTAVEVLGHQGVDLSAHRSRRLVAALVASADLLLGMERRHVREVVLLDRLAFGRAFTLKELVRAGHRIGARGADESVEEWLARAHLGRRAADLLGSSEDDDVADPIGQSPAVYRATARELDDLTTHLVDLVWGQPAAHDAERQPA